MTAYDFSLVANTSISFDPDADSLSFSAISAADVAISVSGSNLVLTSGGQSVTLRNLTLGELSATNIIFTDGSSLVVGDGLSAIDDDNAAQTGGTAINIAGDDDNQVRGMGGADSITVGNGNNLIFGGSNGVDAAEGGNDTITIGTGANTVFGNGGDDTINIGATASGNETKIYGGNGDDVVTSGIAVDGSTILVAAGKGADDIDLSASLGTTIVFGGNGGVDIGDGDDTIQGGAGDSYLYGNGGDDEIALNTTGDHEALAHGGRGDDTIESAVAGTADTQYVIFGGLGEDSISLSAVTFAGDATIYGGAGNADTADGADSIVSGTGNSVIFGNGGDDVIVLNGTGAGKTGYAHGGAGDDRLIANAIDATADVTLVGGEGEDSFETTNMVAGSTITIADFDAADDTLDLDVSGVSAITELAITTSGGDMTIFLDSDLDGVRDAGEEATILEGFTGPINAGTGSATITTVAGGTLAYNVGGAAAVLTGTNNADLLIAGDNGDTLIAGTNLDKLVGGDGDDVFQHTDGAFNSQDTVIGGDGEDTLELLDASTAANSNDADFTNVSDVEVFLLSADTNHEFDDLGTIAETAGISFVDATALTGTNALILDASGYLAADLEVRTGSGTGTDDITTGGGDDYIATGGGNDTISSGAGDDQIFAGAADDTINAGTGADTINGGAGFDTLIFASNDSGFTTTTVDKITSHYAGGNSGATPGDLIDFGSIDAFVDDTATSYAGSGSLLLAAQAAATANFGSANNGSSDTAVLFVYGSETYLLLQNDDNSAALEQAEDILIQVTGYTGTFDDSDFV